MTPARMRAMPHNRSLHAVPRIAQPGDRGFVALLTVTIIGALILAIGLSAAYVGQTETVISGDFSYGQSARAMATACAEEALFRLKRNASYAGGSVAIGPDTCSVTVSGSGNTRTVTATGVSGSYTRRVTVSALQKSNGAGSAKGWTVDAWVEGDSP